MTTPDVVSWWLIIFMAALGVVSMWLKQMMMARKEAIPDMKPLSLRTYWLTYWPNTLFALTSTAGGLVFFDYLNLLGGKAGPALGFGIGYIANNIADLVGSRVQALINTPPKTGD